MCLKMVQQTASRVCIICSRLKPDLGGNNPGVQVCASNLVDCSLSQSLIHGTRKSWLGSFNNRVMLAILIACMSYPVQIFRLCIYWKGSMVLVSQLKGRLKIENWFINKPMDYWIIGLINQWLSYSPTLLTGTIADRNVLDLGDDSTSRNAQMPQPDTGWTFCNAGRHVPVWKIDQQLNSHRTDEVCINLYWGVLWLDCLWPRGIACFGASFRFFLLLKIALLTSK